MSAGDVTVDPGDGPVIVRKRPAESEAYRYDGTRRGAELIVAWAEGHAYIAEGQLYVMTDRGTDIPADAGDYIVRGLVRELYPCKPDAFEAGWEVIGRA